MTTVREQFERWHYRKVGFDVSCWRAETGGGYAHAHVQQRWEAWTAAFKAGREQGRRGRRGK